MSPEQTHTPNSIASTPFPAASLPIIAHIPVQLDAEERRRVGQIATKLLTNEPALRFATEAFGPRVSVGLGSGPSLLLQNLEGGALVTAPVDSLLQYRMLLLAQDGDQVARSIRRSRSFETSCREMLNLGQVDIASPALAAPESWSALPSNCGSREGAGDPVVEGVFHQVVEGPVGEFIGVVPSALPESWRLRLGHESLLLGGLLQEVGYFGRCSFDAIVVGEELDSATLHWIECNGRWGGTSLPMTLANRLVGDWSRHPFVVVQRGPLYTPPRDFAAVLDRLKERLFRAGPSVCGVILLIPGRFENGTGLDFLVLAETRVAARSEAATVTELLTTDTGSP